MPCAGSDVNEVIVFLSNPIPKNPLSGSAKKPNPYLDLQAEHLPDPAAALLLFIQKPAGSQHHCYARSTSRTRSTQNKNMHPAELMWRPRAISFMYVRKRVIILRGAFHKI
jgi:hypothetical protein